MACRSYNSGAADFKQWSHDLECFKKDWNLEEPAPDAPDAGPHDFVHAQWERDVAAWQASGGVANMDDIARLAPVAASIEGIITGRAIYEGTLPLVEAIEACKNA